MLCGSRKGHCRVVRPTYQCFPDDDKDKYIRLLGVNRTFAVRVDFADMIIIKSCKKLARSCGVTVGVKPNVASIVCGECLRHSQPQL